jgi:hypothetical protein
MKLYSRQLLASCSTIALALACAAAASAQEMPTGAHRGAPASDLRAFAVTPAAEALEEEALAEEALEGEEASSSASESTASKAPGGEPLSAESGEEALAEEPTESEATLPEEAQESEAGKSKSGHGAGGVRPTELRLARSARNGLRSGHLKISQIAFTFKLSRAASVSIQIERARTRSRRRHWQPLAPSLALSARRGLNHARLRGKLALKAGSYRIELAVAHGGRSSLLLRVR